MKFKRLTPVFLIGLGIFIGYAIGVTMDPVDRAIRKAQKINRTSLAGVSSLREGGALNIFGFFKKTIPLQEKIKTDPSFSNQYVSRISNNLVNKEQAIVTLDEAKEFIELATQEVFIDTSLQRYLVSLGRIQLENGMVFRALANLERAYEINPYDSSVSQLLSTSYLGLYQVYPEGSDKYQAGEKAVQFLKLTLLTKPNSINTMYGLALIYTDQGLHADALPIFLQILDLDPEHIDSLLGIARIYYDQGDTDQARRIYEQTEALILELKNKRHFIRQKLNIGILDQKLITIRNNLEILYKSQNAFGNN